MFGERAKQIPISSNKSMIGHTLSAAGAVEAIFTLLTLDRQRIPPTINYLVPDPAIPLDVVPNVARDARVTCALSNSFGFGGQNVSLVLSREPAYGRMRALTLVADRKLELADMPPPPAPGPGEVQIRVRAVALNHIDVWGYRGMAFAKRKLPLVVGAEAAGEIAAVGPDVDGVQAGDPVVMYGALTCGTCRACREGRDNLCENVAGVMGFHVDGFARDLVNLPARLTIPVPGGRLVPRCRLRADRVLDRRAHAVRQCQLKPGETILVHAGGSGIGTAAIQMAKQIGCTVITTVGSDEKVAKAKALGADHVINYRSDRFEHAVRKITAKKGVDVVFEHVGADTFNGSLLSLKRGGRLVTCGATSGAATTLNLMQLFQQQYRIIGSFGASMRNIRDALAKMQAGLRPVIDTEVALAEFERGLQRLESRQVFGKIVVMF